VWTQKDPRKALVPPLFSFLKNGTFGSARLSYPSLLPMVAAMPAQIVGTSESTFWEPLFSALTDGASKSEQFGGLENSKAFLEAYRDLWQLLLSHTMDPIPLQGRLDLAVSQLSWLASAILKEVQLFLSCCEKCFYFFSPPHTCRINSRQRQSQQRSHSCLTTPSAGPS